MSVRARRVRRRGTPRRPPRGDGRSRRSVWALALSITAVILSFYHTCDIKEEVPLETVLNLLLIRFGVIAAGLVVLALVAFAVALSVRRRGDLNGVRRYAAPAARTAARYLDGRAGTSRSPSLTAVALRT